MNILAAMEEFDHEELIFFQDKDVGLKAIVAIHNTVLGPALGGTRMRPYASEEEALKDVLRLSRGMTYKAAAAGLNLGGGKAVIIGDPKKDKSQTLFSVYGKFLNTLGGRYITAEDSGTDVNDIEYMFTETDYVVGIETSHGGSGDPSPFTALGVFQGIQACCSRVYGKDGVRGKTVVVQGVGNVGGKLARLLVGAGAKVVISDVDAGRVEQVKRDLSVEAVPADQVFGVACDIFAPCALGSVLNDATVNQLQCKIVAGGANNQLERPEHAEQLRQRGIIYAPDYVINAGGLMNVYLELEGYSRERAERMTRGIYYNLMQIFQLSDQMKITTAAAADRLAEQRLEKISRASAIFMPHKKDIVEKMRLRRRH
ncbi:MAG: Glu/Leu/Phe/Val dehydrogenase [Deltaproteobacteria bacterium]|nr:Glu/Leu/Phe/Val dehydrogenase [Deltaproteobacteria bacterium]